MQALAAHNKGPKKRRWPWVVGAVVVALMAGGGGYALAMARSGGDAGAGGSADCHGAACTGPSGPTSSAIAELSVAQTDPVSGAKDVPSSTTVTVKFSQPIQAGGPMPSITPSVNGTWHQHGRSELVFSPSAPFVPYDQYTVTVPGGSGGVVSAGGLHLGASTVVTFTIAPGSTLRLEQLLAMLNYLPLSYTEPSGVPPRDMAEPQTGTLAWRWQGTPLYLTAEWAQGNFTTITKGAVMQFETQNGLPVDGVPGPQVWSTLLAAIAFDKADSAPYTYVVVTKGLPEHLTAWVNGQVQFSHILVNTGVPGATTTDGTFPVFEHVRASTMIGTNVTGSHYDDPTVPWASYFNGGDALHGFVRAQYGFPQSNGCVEMRVSTAGALWPYTVVGTLVSVVG